MTIGIQSSNAVLTALETLNPPTGAPGTKIPQGLLDAMRSIMWTRVDATRLLQVSAQIA